MMTKLIVVFNRKFFLNICHYNQKVNKNGITTANLNLKVKFGHPLSSILNFTI